MASSVCPHDYLRFVESSDQRSPQPRDINELNELLGTTDAGSGHWVENIPFAGADVTAGTETELQAAVVGHRGDMDLAQVIEGSSFFKNMVQRAAAGDTSRRHVTALENYLDQPRQVWENSWVQFPHDKLNGFAQMVFERDLLADKRCNDSPLRCDARQFTCRREGRLFLRLPISYLLKLALAQVIGHAEVHPVVRSTGERMMNHFLNDNTSPETHSYHPVSADTQTGVGGAIAADTALRYLLTQLLIQYANHAFELGARGQLAAVYFAPHPPIRQKQLNELVSDAFYRELFMSPCLSGWDRGEDKRNYMALCHEVLSRSQLNGIAKLKEAGIITRDLVVLPNLSNISLANNGTHVSLGSRRLTALLRTNPNGLSEIDEKFYGDLAIKICEHFLPLFVGSYSAAPYRLDFTEFHPEKVLGFLPHELEQTHLQMVWRRWKKKARLGILGQPLTPFGPQWLDGKVGRMLGLNGDYVRDYRLIDYLAAVLSTAESPALNGLPDSDQKLKKDLAAQGIFDDRMPLYLLYRLRCQKVMGFSGFEGRHYSLFESLRDDLAAAVDLQTLITALAYKYILCRRTSHADIPDTPFVESERRQIFFGVAIGLPTFFVRQDSGNHFLHYLLKHTRNTRTSRRYAGYVRVQHHEFRLALVRVLRQDGADLIEMMRLQPRVEDLEQRMTDPQVHSCADRLTSNILGRYRHNDPMRLSAREFNVAAEAYYRKPLRYKHMQEGFELFIQAVNELDSWRTWRQGLYTPMLMGILKGMDAGAFLAAAQRAALNETLPPETCSRLIQLMLLVMHDVQRREEEKHHA